MSGREEQLRAVAEDVRQTLIAEHRDRAARGESGPEPIADAVRRLVDEGATAILDADDRDRIANLVLRETVGLGPLEELLEDPGVEEVLVNGHGRVYIGRAGIVEPTDVAFPDEEACATRSSGSSRRSAAASTSSARWPTRGSPTGPASTS